MRAHALAALVLVSVLGRSSVDEGVARGEDAATVTSATGGPGTLAPPAIAPNAIGPLLDGKVFPATVKVYGAGGFVGVPAYATGVIINEDGVVATSWSIALKTPALKIVTDKGQRLEAKILRADPRRGVALLTVDWRDQRPPPIELGDSDAVKPGDTVYAIGNAFDDAAGDEKCGLVGGVVAAVSELDMRIGIEDGPALGKVILTDAPNNPGTQGGPLVDRNGKLVGILGRVVESKSTNTTINYAIPAATVKQVLKDAMDGKEPPAPAPAPRRIYVDSGVRLLDAHIVRSPPAWVERVVPGSAAAKAGVKPDDLIFRVDGRVVRNCQAFEDIVSAALVGKTGPVKLKLIVKRGKSLVDLELELEAKGK